MQPTKNSPPSGTNPSPKDPYVADYQNDKHPSALRSFLSSFLLIAAALLFALFINTFLFQSYEVDGSSMEPTLQNHNRLIIWKFPRTLANTRHNTYIPRRGDIIVFHKPDGSDEQLIKRVIALPGEHVIVKDHHITVYNSSHPEGIHPDEDKSYGKTLQQTNGNVDVYVGQSEIFVSGDNRTPGGSLDSRTGLGNVPLNLIVGKLALRLFPLQEITKF